MNYYEVFQNNHSYICLLPQRVVCPQYKPMKRLNSSIIFTHTHTHKIYGCATCMRLPKCQQRLFLGDGKRNDFCSQVLVTSVSVTDKDYVIKASKVKC